MIFGLKLLSASPVTICVHLSSNIWHLSQQGTAFEVVLHNYWRQPQIPIINGNIIYEFGEILLCMWYLHYNNKYTTIWKYKTWKIICIQIAVDKGLRCNNRDKMIDIHQWICSSMLNSSRWRQALADDAVEITSFINTSCLNQTKFYVYNCVLRNLACVKIKKNQMQLINFLIMFIHR